LSQVDTRYVWLLVIAGVGVAIGYLRGLNAMLASPKGQNQTEQAGPAWPAMIFLVALSLLSVGLAIYPDPLLQAAQRLLTAYPLPPL
jgi:formate hydrogenlyase subunit 3/multisubunit Na+/H+ antiporter MnhD subunit